MDRFQTLCTKWNDEVFDAASGYTSKPTTLNATPFDNVTKVIRMKKISIQQTSSVKTRFELQIFQNFINANYTWVVFLFYCKGKICFFFLFLIYVSVKEDRAERSDPRWPKCDGLGFYCKHASLSMYIQLALGIILHYDRHMHFFLLWRSVAYHSMKGIGDHQMAWTTHSQNISASLYDKSLKKIHSLLICAMMK